MQAIDTQDNAVKVPIPCEIINAGGTIIDKGLIASKLIFIAWANSKKPITKIICLELITGFSFCDIKIKIPQQISISTKLMNHEKIIPIFKFSTESILYEESVAITIQSKKITNLSIVFNSAGFLTGTWLLYQDFCIIFDSLLRFCTEYN